MRDSRHVAGLATVVAVLVLASVAGVAAAQQGSPPGDADAEDMQNLVEIVRNLVGGLIALVGAVSVGGALLGRGVTWARRQAGNTNETYSYRDREYLVRLGGFLTILAVGVGIMVGGMVAWAAAGLGVLGLVAVVGNWLRER